MKWSFELINLLDKNGEEEVEELVMTSSLRKRLSGCRASSLKSLIKHTSLPLSGRGSLVTAAAITSPFEPAEQVCAPLTNKQRPSKKANIDLFFFSLQNEAGLKQV